jgi:hypothetical protein
MIPRLKAWSGSLPIELSHSTDKIYEPSMCDCIAVTMPRRYGLPGGLRRMSEKKRLLAKILSVISLTIVALVGAFSTPAGNQPEIPTIDAGIGSCRADFNVKDGSGKPIYNAKINTTIKYGFTEGAAATRRGCTTNAD